MFRFVSNLSIFNRLAVVFASATIVPIVVIVLLGNFYLQSIGVRSQAVQTSFDAQNIATKEQINLQRMNALLQARFAQIVAQNSPSLGGDPALSASGQLDSADITALEIDFDQTLTSYRTSYEISTSPNMAVIHNILVSDTPDHGQQVITDQQSALDAVSSTDWRLYRDAQTKLLTELDSPGFNYLTSYQDFYTADLDFLNLRIHWQQVVDASTTMGTAVTRVGPSLTNPLILYTGGSLLFTLLVIIAGAFLINLTIVNPLRALVALTRRIAQGDNRARAEIHGRDEISQVATSINGMLDVIVQLMQESQFLHANLQTNIEKLIHEVGGIGEGDLRKQARVEDNEIGPLASFFNIMVEELSNLVVNVKTMARGVQMSTLQVFGYIEQLVDSTDAQTQQINKAAGEIDTMATTSRKMAERAHGLYDQAQEARQIVLEGRKTIRRTVNSIERVNDNIHTTSAQVVSLGDRSREISNIVEVITGIAQQTNRLALDAAVQAAMAGENGKGFGAVAVDIRRLSERTKEQTTIIGQIVANVLEDISTARHLIQTTEQDTRTGAQLTRQIGSSLETIFAVVEHQAAEIEIANQDAKQQLQSATMVVQLTQSVSEAGQQNSGSAREVTRQVERLAQLAGQLLSSVEVFKLREVQSAAPKPPMSASPQRNSENGISMQSLRNAPNRFRRPGNQPSSPNISSGSYAGFPPPQTSPLSFPRPEQAQHERRQ
jgi:methyl-accepting chemotaxis protein